MYTERFERLYKTLHETQPDQPLDAVALNPSSTLTYLTGLGFHLMERPTVLLAVPGKVPALVLPELEMQKVKSAPVRLQTFPYGDNPATWPRAFSQAAQALGLNGKKIGVEPTRMRVLELRYLESALPDADFVSAEPVLSALRIRKDAAEVESMRTAVRIAQQALQATLPMIKPGVTERQVASELFIQLLRAGTDPELPFQPIVSGGPHSADPHASPSDRPLQTGDLLVIDWGAAHQGYISDLTRTFAIGPVEPEFQRIYELVLLANQAGREASKPGIPAGQVDRAARAVIEDSGFGQYFFHRVGHGIGMEAHEPPYMFGENELILAPDMTYTVEPGIYLPGRGGVRIEDNVVITTDGAESLSDLPRELVTLG
ncbi:MAG: aminopeptidase P family protein [Chloroflexi bacterium]|nr:MAG: aminopeptidase P family protein [Chloroflexota bacterium]